MSNQTNISDEDKATKKQMEEQAKRTSTLQEGAKIKPEDQEVKTDELLTTDQKAATTFQKFWGYFFVALIIILGEKLNGYEFQFLQNII